MKKYPVALYMQDKHPFRDDALRAGRGRSRLLRGLASGIPPRPGSHGAYGRVRRQTHRIKVGSGVISMWTRNPALIAQTFSTLDDLAPDRIMLGLGAWWEPLASKVGVRRERPLTAMREIVEVLPPPPQHGNGDVRRRYVNVQDISIDIVHGERKPKKSPYTSAPPARK